MKSYGNKVLIVQGLTKIATFNVTILLKQFWHEIKQQLLNTGLSVMLI